MTPDPCKLLVVDDNPQNRDLLRRSLTSSGYAVEVAEGGAEALEKINRAHYDLILLDQVMPGMSGLDLLAIAASNLFGQPTSRHHGERGK